MAEIIPREISMKADRYAVTEYDLDLPKEMDYNHTNQVTVNQL